MANFGESFALGFLGTIQRNMETRQEAELERQKSEAAFRREIDLQNYLMESREERERKTKAQDLAERQQLADQTYTASKRVQAILPKEAAMALDPEKIAGLEVQLSALERSQQEQKDNEAKDRELAAKDVGFLVDMVKANVQDPSQRDRFLSMLQEKQAVLQTVPTVMGDMPLPAIQTINKELSKTAANSLTDQVSDYLGHQRKLELADVKERQRLLADEMKRAEALKKATAEANSVRAFLKERGVSDLDTIDDPTIAIKTGMKLIDELVKNNPSDTDAIKFGRTVRMKQIDMAYKSKLEQADALRSRASASLFPEEAQSLLAQADEISAAALADYDKATDVLVTDYSTAKQQTAQAAQPVAVALGANAQKMTGWPKEQLDKALAQKKITQAEYDILVKGK